MKRLTVLAAIAATSLLPVAAHAEGGISWNYWELDYVSADVDGLSGNLDGFGVAGSVEIRGPVFLYANYSQVDKDISGFKVKDDETQVGLGYAWSVTDNFDIFGTAGWAHAHGGIEHIGYLNDDGYALGVGARARFIDQLEVEGGVQYVDLSDFGDTTSVGVGAQWYFTPGVAASVGYSVNDDGSTLLLGVRGTWGR